jgi:hypothetical protein
MALFVKKRANTPPAVQVWCSKTGTITIALYFRGKDTLELAGGPSARQCVFKRV